MAARRSRPDYWLLGLAALLLIGAGALGWQLAGAAPESAEPAPARPPAVPLARLGGGSAALADYVGQVVIVDFWASWCGPCRLQARILAKLHEELGEQVQFLAVNLGEDLETVERYVADHAFPYPVLMDPEERMAQALEIYVLPTVMVLDREGRISYLHLGISDRPALVAALAGAGVGLSDGRPT